MKYDVGLDITGVGWSSTQCWRDGGSRAQLGHCAYELGLSVNLHFVEEVLHLYPDRADADVPAFGNLPWFKTLGEKTRDPRLGL